MGKMVVEVCYAEDNINIFFVALMAEPGATVKDVVIASGVLAEYKSLNVEDMDVGINSKNAALNDTVEAEDRIVIFRPLKILPQEARRLRAKKNKTQ